MIGKLCNFFNCSPPKLLSALPVITNMANEILKLHKVGTMFRGRVVSISSNVNTTCFPEIVFFPLCLINSSIDQTIDIG